MSTPASPTRAPAAPASPARPASAAPPEKGGPQKEASAPSAPNPWEKHPQALAVFLRWLPLDQRARCARVSKSWRGVCNAPETFKLLDASEDSGLSRPMSGAVLLALAKRGGGHVELMDLTGCEALDVRTAMAAARCCPRLLEFRASRLGTGGAAVWSMDDIQQLLNASPGIRALEVDAEDEIANFDSQARGFPLCFDRTSLPQAEPAASLRRARRVTLLRTLPVMATAPRSVPVGAALNPPTLVGPGRRDVDIRRHCADGALLAAPRSRGAHLRWRHGGG